MLDSAPDHPLDLLADALALHGDAAAQLGDEDTSRALLDAAALARYHQLAGLRQIATMFSAAALVMRGAAQVRIRDAARRITATLAGLGTRLEEGSRDALVAALGSETLALRQLKISWEHQQQEIRGLRAEIAALRAETQP